MRRFLKVEADFPEPRGSSLRLKGVWLEKAGFPVGSVVRVQDDGPGRLMLSVENPPETLREPEQAYLWGK